MLNRQTLLLGTVGALALTAADAGKKGVGYTTTPLIPGTKWHVHDGDRPVPITDGGKPIAALFG